MWLNQLFMDSAAHIEKRCKVRIAGGLLLAVLGLAAIFMVIMFERIPLLYLEEGGSEFMKGFYTGTGGGLLGAGIVTAMRNMRILKNPEMKKKREIWEFDERNRMLGLRCWAYAGYAMFVLLYIGMLAGGFIGKTVLLVLIAVAAVYALLLLVFRIILEKTM